MTSFQPLLSASLSWYIFRSRFKISGTGNFWLRPITFDRVLPNKRKKEGERSLDWYDKQDGYKIMFLEKLLFDLIGSYWLAEMLTLLQSIIYWQLSDWKFFRNGGKFEDAKIHKMFEARMLDLKYFNIWILITGNYFIIEIFQIWHFTF